MELKSSAFTAGEMIPKKYTCDGPDVSPPLSWSDVPAGAKSLALIADDPDAPMGTWVHWVAWNIPPNARGLMVLAIEGTPEYRGKLIDSYFFTYLKRHADGNAISIFSNYLAAGGTFEGIKGIIIGSDEYFAKRANNNPNTFINVLFLDTLGRPADPAAQQNLFSYAAGGAAKRTFLAQAVITTPG